ncbi:O-methyltransferase, family 2 [Niveomyces insectorum RCEF 264]|uniref:O-methyltransferase, family 2 n=1 Tax=Niveomyces insectorum RCEF 264 TaxID=1081102 RepID=A0A167PXT6_9HYPO|nr:O-methyltransferase, family 2 [Niveomyces insectorum RCEF 264]
MAGKQTTEQQNELADKLGSLAAELAEASNAVRAGKLSLQTDVAQKLKLIGTTKATLDALQTSQDLFMDNMVQFSRLVALRVFLKWKAFDAIPPTGSITYADLAAKVNADVEIITRLAWVLVGDGTLKQENGDKVAHTPKSQLYQVPAMQSMAIFGFDFFLKTMVYMPGYFDEFGRKTPTDRLNTVVACAAGFPGTPVWGVLKQMPELMAHFTRVMTVFESSYPTLGAYDISWLVDAAHRAPPGRVALVDVGGSKGHSLKKIHAEVPNFPLERCVLEDLEEVLALAATEDDEQLRPVKRVVTDFHKEQPVKGALVYYIRRCLHDYSDAESVGILKHLEAAMASDSKLLIVEHVMSDPPSPFAASSDLYMACLSGKERTLKNFEAITSQAGLKIASVYRNPGVDAAIVECVKA